MNRNPSFLDGVVEALIKHITPSRLINFVAKAHSTEMDKSRRKMLNEAHQGLFWEGGLPGFYPLKSDANILLSFYERFGHLIPEEYRKEGIRRAEESKDIPALSYAK